MLFLRHQELRNFKHVGYDYYCEEPFTVKDKSRYNCETAVFLDLFTDVIKKNCQFMYYLNDTTIKPAACLGGKEIIVANWLNKKSIECTSNSDIPVTLPDYTS